ncbi:unnamed protein product [Auanema sp. JU1783]|nr:unnamed protein product [Auanema sp. JU1783]
MISIRPATDKDASIILGMIRELAEFEKMADSVELTEQKLAEDLKSEACSGLLAYDMEVAVGMILYYFAYSTWQGQYIHMEDLYIKRDFRRRGIGNRLWAELSKIAKSRGCKRLQWNVLDWNKPAIEFYKMAPFIDLSKEGWLTYRLDDKGIAQLADA